MEAVIVAGPSSPELSRKVASLLRLEAIEVFHKFFPDGESYMRLEGNVTGKTAILVQGTHPPQDVHTLQLLLLARTLRERGASEMIAVVPYLAYARQDREFLPGEVVSLKHLLGLLTETGVRTLVTVNPHSPWALNLKGLNSVSVDVTSELAEEASKSFGKFDVVASPGKKGETMAKAAGDAIGAEWAALTSSRDPWTGRVEVRVMGTSVKGRRVLVIDDIISTGGTMVEAIRALNSLGATAVVVACVHGLFVGNAARKILESGALNVLSTDTVPSIYSRLSVAEELVEALRPMIS
ncbi:MAG: ribose-phosphate diphosphokinase [Thaumarchaeota archaeon]|nr:ribose-phosphate diphosphokinase [Candidatus Calditenuaceae archaeon]MDW8187576.1 ribose-phosphate diphosphokinase [Nitrososphaerota archaeon]